MTAIGVLFAEDARRVFDELDAAAVGIEPLSASDWDEDEMPRLPDEARPYPPPA